MVMNSQFVDHLICKLKMNYFKSVEIFLTFYFNTSANERKKGQAGLDIKEVKNSSVSEKKTREKRAED